MLNKTVLLVEKNPPEAERITEFFRRNGFRNQIDVVHSKEEAMEYVFQIGKYARKPDYETPGLILLDLLTDKTPHVKILKPLHLYLRTAEIPIVILTSSDEQEKEIADYKIGVVGFLRKPFDFTNFIELIQQMGMNWEHSDDSVENRNKTS